ncbi:ISNCY family transposase [Rhizobium tumorigenes]|uniref:ISNCY family transposase n=1 Tax=Rhizobium tumorigenes TaxID=2041385 RepID=A0AAF1KKL0_9HYPH|nr:ISNCY family transposase [Rhizobium tumorigenes]WFR96856.1 ISNCY family transposase [Rhizobium tumorigenes]WFR97847.1 ISNCY family transposase [Rhizobium tumorigenes]WFR98846.1 ISNCY family transposase [Rhizobium tumorigenes]WFR99090.1 ISNCY family transposase [Rhizobium tumorigenes]WFR99257.1 ISNCY family transposase [Rhizobium tumorigenes]
MSCLITMSQKELHRLEVIQKIRDHRLSVVQAAELLDLCRSQVHRLLQAYDSAGSAGLVSKKRSRPSNRRHSEDFRNAALDLIRERYLDFGPTLAREKLIELHQISVAKETLRQWMTEAGIWTSRRARKKRVFQPRGRRDCFGELVQIDGSHHWWFESRGPKCALLVYIDDATGKLLHLRFAGSENTFDYLHATKAYLQQWGKPLAFYSDKHGVFRATHASEKDRTSGLTQFGRALYELNIDIICANTPQAKGRVERANQTLQDRLVKELRLHGIDTIAAANAYAPEFIADFNGRFGKSPRNPKDMHRSLADHENLDGAMCRKEVRTLSQALTLRYDKVLFILDPTDLSRPLSGKKVVVCDYPDGRLEIMHESFALPYRTFDKLRSVHRPDVVENKRLDDMLSVVAEMQAGRELHRSKSGPRRTGQTDHMFGIRDGSQGNGYQKRGRKPRTDYMNDPAVIAKRQKALARMEAAE